MKQRKIKDYIRGSFIKYSVLVILAILSVFLISLYFIFIASVAKPNKSLNKELVDVIDQEFIFYKDEIIRLSHDEAVKRAIQSEVKSHKMVQALYNVKNQGQSQSNFVLLDEDRNVLSSSFNNEARDHVIGSFLFNNIIDQLDDKGYNENSLANFLRPAGKSLYYFGANIKDGYETIGYLVFFVDDFSFTAKYNQTIYVTDEYGNVIFNTNSLGINRLGKLEIDTSQRIKGIHNDFFYINNSSISNNSIHVVTMTSINTYRNLLFYGVISMTIVGMIIILIVYLVSPKILQKTLQPFDVLVSVISNDNQEDVDVTHFNEFQTIYKEYNSKIREIQHLIQMNKEITEKKRVMEIKHLEAKFNPHFLYNILEMLKYEITLDPQNASNIVVKVANLMRYNTNFGSTTVPLAIDIENLNDYVDLQKMRYGDRLDFSSKVEQDLLQVNIPKLIIQPLVENAIKHNIQDVHKLGIQLTITKMDDEMEIEVIDNGVGINDEKLEKIRQMIVNDEDESNHNGLKNTHHIIQLLYGEKFGLEIDSKVNEQTTVRLKIPLMG